MVVAEPKISTTALLLLTAVPAGASAGSSKKPMSSKSIFRLAEEPQRREVRRWQAAEQRRPGVQEQQLLWVVGEELPVPCHQTRWPPCVPFPIVPEAFQYEQAPELGQMHHHALGEEEEEDAPKPPPEDVSIWIIERGL
jgi:hypothetical protein